MTIPFYGQLFFERKKVTSQGKVYCTSVELKDIFILGEGRKNVKFGHNACKFEIMPRHNTTQTPFQLNVHQESDWPETDVKIVG